MPNSLKARLGKLKYKGVISDKDYERLCKALEQEPILDKRRILGIEAKLQAIKEIASYACDDIKDEENIAEFCDEIYNLVNGER